VVRHRSALPRARVIAKAASVGGLVHIGHPRDIGYSRFCEVSARLVEVHSVGHSGLDLLRLSSSHFDP